MKFGWPYWPFLDVGELGRPEEDEPPHSARTDSCPRRLVLPKGLHPDGHANVESLRRRRVRTGQVKEKAESCAVDLEREESGEGW